MKGCSQTSRATRATVRIRAAAGPCSQNVFGHPVQLHDGTIVTADENYLRESILTPAAKLTAGYQPVMPAFQGLVSEEQLLALIEYVKSLSTPRESTNP